MVTIAVTGLAIANIGFHLRAEGGGLDVAVRSGLALLVVLLALIGGRVTPSFTRNWLLKRGGGRLPSPASHFDILVLAVTVGAMIGWIIAPDQTVVAAALIVGGGLHLVRLTRWAGWRTGAEPLVWVLHLGYAWLGLGLTLLGLSSTGDGWIPASAGIHALTAGAMGVMIMAVATRATRGHTGRELAAGAGTTILYVLINAAALVRVAGGLWPAQYDSALILSGALWAAAMLGFCVLYGPMLMRQRLRA